MCLEMWCFHGNQPFAGSYLSGSDGTRTRDLRRDRFVSTGNSGCWWAMDHVSESIWYQTGLWMPVGSSVYLPITCQGRRGIHGIRDLLVEAASAGGLAGLLRRANLIRVRAEHAAVAVLGTQPCRAGRAGVEELACVRRHRLAERRRAFRARNRCRRHDLYHRVTLSPSCAASTLYLGQRAALDLRLCG